MAALDEIRDLRADELGFLREMLVAALAWRPDRRLPPRFVLLAIPQVSLFHRGWGRAGDHALVAVQNGRLIGVVWMRYFTYARHGEGFIDETTPELAIAVVKECRGMGIGRELMEAMHERARSEGISRISLSVDAGNPAKRLYARLGYRDYQPDDELGRMVLDLNRR
jgi:GNAT superfamily N-acetyltransferase